MDYIILNNDGSIANIAGLVNPKLKRYIQQGNNGVDKIFIGWPLGLATDYGQAVFTLANQLTNTVLGEFKANYPYEADDPENPPSDYDGETCNGWVITLTSDQTIYNGGLFVSFRVIRNGIVQVAFPFTLMINETGVRPDTDSGVTIAQLDSYLLNIQNLVTGAVRQNTDAIMSETSENPVQNKVVTARINQAIAGVYKPGGSIDVATLNATSKTESLNGYVYNIIDSGNLTNYDGTFLAVRAGDNVCFLWNNGDWHFDNMVGFIDTTNFVTKTGINLMNGYYQFDDGEIRFWGDAYHRFTMKLMDEADSVQITCYDPENDPEEETVVGAFTTEGFYAPVVRTQKLKNNNADYGLLLPDMSDWTNDKTIGDLASAKLYLHRVKLSFNSEAIIYSTNSTPFTAITFALFLYNKGFRDYSTIYPSVVQTELGGSYVLRFFRGFYSANGTTIQLVMSEFTLNTNAYGIASHIANSTSTPTFVSDTVEEIN